MNETVSPPTQEPVPVEPAPVRGEPKRRRRRTWFYFALLAFLAGVGLFFLWPKPPNQRGTAKPPGKAAAPGRGGSAGPVPVVSVKAQQGNIGVFITGLGAVTPISTVTVRTRVDGQLTASHFTEGQ